MGKVLIITGPTAVGKTEHAIAAARALGGEIISADSMQIYKGFDIGSAKPSARERTLARHHLIDFADPKEPFTAANYQELALKKNRRAARQTDSSNSLRRHGTLYQFYHV